MASQKRKKAKPRSPTKRSQQEREQGAEAVAADLAEQERGPSAGDRYAQIQRDSEIWRAAMRGLQPESIGPAYGLQPSTVRDIIRRMGGEAARIADQDPAEIIQEHIWKLDAAIDELAAIASKKKGSARVAAIRARIEAMKDKMESLQSVGYLPHDLGTIGLQIDINALYHVVTEVLIAEKVPRKTILKIADALDPLGVDVEPPKKLPRKATA